MEEQTMAQQNTIMMFMSGSNAYGTVTENSDKDYIGVFIPNEEYILGNRICEQVQIRTNPSGSKKQNTKDDSDAVIYSLPKYIKLLTVNNPTILETLFYPKNCVIKMTPYGQKILDSYKIFVSKKVKHTFLGYSFSQKKALTHKKERYEEIGKALRQLDEYEKDGWIQLPERLHLVSQLREDKSWGEYEKGQPIGFVKEKLIEELKSYGHRIEDIKKYGFSLKFASHLIRLLDEGLQILVEGKLDLPLPANNVVRDIKMGKLPLQDILAMADTKEKLTEEAYIRSPLPRTPDLESIEKLQISLIKDFWKDHGSSQP